MEGIDLIQVSEYTWVNTEDISRVEWATYAPVIIMKSQARVPAPAFGAEFGQMASPETIAKCMATLVEALVPR